jgi:hypothetical protein
MIWMCMPTCGRFWSIPGSNGDLFRSRVRGEIWTLPVRRQEDVHTTKAGRRETPQADAKDMEGLVTLTCEAGSSDAGMERRPEVPDGVTSTPGGTWIQPWTNLVRG